jgi:hypothetical protein
VTYVRVTRDQRGYETTFLLHSARPGAPPRVLYWYRTAPGVRVGRIALDEDAIRSIEEQHPDIDFDWPQLLEEASTTPPEIERRPERRRKPSRPRDEAAVESDTATPEAADVETAVEAPIAREPDLAAVAEPEPQPERPRNVLLDQLVGREIAGRLRARYRDVCTRIGAADQTDEQRTRWQARADALDPDRWLTPAEILHGVEHADALFDQLRREIGGTQ